MNTHTPGPWTVAYSPDSGDDSCYAIFEDDGLSDARFDDDFISITNLNHANHEANARLIAAAPDLLKALDNLARYADTCELFLKETHPGKADALRDLVTNSLTAIAKATGSAT